MPELKNWDDPDAEELEMPMDTSRELVELLLHRPTVDEVSQFLVLSGVPALHPWQAAIYAIDSSSRLRLLGSFGLERGRGDLDGKSCLDTPLVSDVLRWHRPQTNLSIASEGSNSGQGSEEESQLIWPLSTPSRLRGILQLRFTGNTIDEKAESEAASVAPILSLLLELLSVPEEASGNGLARAWGALSTHSDGNSPAVNTHPRHASTDWRRGIDRDRPRALSARQQRVLELMSQGMTNGQIARALKFSESTVRQETMAIYRYLQVPGRVEAVEVAIERGLLPQPDPVSAP